MRFGALVVQAVGESQVLGVVSDGHVLVPVFAGGLRHLLDGAFAVGLHRVHVNVALKIGLGDQLRKFAFHGGLYFAAILAQFRRNEFEPQLFINLFLGLSRDALVVFHAYQAVFVERVALLKRALAQLHVVVL